MDSPTSTVDGKGREDYSYIAVLRDQRYAIEKILMEEASKYGYRDFSSFSKNIYGYFIEGYERTHSILHAKDYSTKSVLEGGQKFAKPLINVKQTCQCDCHTIGMEAIKMVRRVKGSMDKDRELLSKFEQKGQEQQQIKPNK